MGREYLTKNAPNPRFHTKTSKLPRKISNWIYDVDDISTKMKNAENRNKNKC